MAIGLAIDPEGYIEDRHEVVGDKLTDGPIKLVNPGLACGNADISVLPKFSVFDICCYLMSNNIPLTSIRDYQRSEAYTMMQDGYVESGTTYFSNFNATAHWQCSEYH
jgi:hypothetical protein